MVSELLAALFIVPLPISAWLVGVGAVEEESPNMCLVWGAGVLFTKINMDTFGDVLAGAFADLDDLLGRAPVARGGNGEARKSDALLMQLAAMCMFVAWNINYAPPDHRPGCVPEMSCHEANHEMSCPVGPIS